MNDQLPPSRNVQRIDAYLEMIDDEFKQSHVHDEMSVQLNPSRDLWVPLSRVSESALRKLAEYCVGRRAQRPLIQTFSIDVVGLAQNDDEHRKGVT